MKNLRLAVILLILAFHWKSVAQNQLMLRHLEKDKVFEIDQTKRVKIYTIDGQRIRGFIDRITLEGISVEGQQINFTQISRLSAWHNNKAVNEGSLVLAGLGAAFFTVGMLAAAEDGDGEVTFGYFKETAIVIGGVVGMSAMYSGIRNLKKKHFYTAEWEFIVRELTPASDDP